MARYLLTLAALAVLLSPPKLLASALSADEDARLRWSARIPAARAFSPDPHPEERLHPEIGDRPREGFFSGVTTATAYHETKAEPKEDQASQTFTPSRPVSFSRFSFIPSRAPPGANTYFRDAIGGFPRSPSRQAPRAPPVPRPVQIHGRGPVVHYADLYETEEEEEKYVPAYKERQHLPDYDSAYENIRFQDDGRDPQYDDHHYIPYYEGDEYQTSPTLRDHHYPPYEESPKHQTDPGLPDYQHYPPSPDGRPPPLLKTPNEEGKGVTKPCRIVQKNDMTCEVCRDDEGSFSEHCSHSTSSDHDETYANSRRHRKRDVVTADPTQIPSGQSRPRLVQQPGSRVDRSAVPEAPSSPTLIAATTTTTATTKEDTHHHGSAHDPTTISSSDAEAESRQEMGFAFDFDDHDFIFSDSHDFDLDHEPAWYHMAAPRTPLTPLRRPSLKDTHAQLTKAMELFMKKDRSSCRKVEKHGMTCYLCSRGAGTTDEECMYASQQPDGHDLHYSEETTYGSSSHYPGASSSSSSSSSFPSRLVVS